MTKQELRKSIKEKLLINKSSLNEWSQIICNQIISFSEYKAASCILAYMALPDEVNLLPLINDALENGKKVYIPKTDPSCPHMEFFELTKECITQSGAFGIQEPQEINPFQITTSPSKSEPKTLALVPGRAFTLTGTRLGRGKAYYDIYFTELVGKITLAGIGFNLQLVPDIPEESHDIKMDYIITESGITDTKARNISENKL